MILIKSPLNGKFFPFFGAPRFQNAPAAGGLGALAKPVGFAPLPLFWLISYAHRTII